MKVIYIGEYYYWKSRIAMSSVYQVDDKGSLKRTDWDLIRTALRRGEEVHIRPANKKEFKQMDKHLEQVEERLK